MDYKGRIIKILRDEPLRQTREGLYLLLTGKNYKQIDLEEKKRIDKNIDSLEEEGFISKGFAIPLEGEGETIVVYFL